MNDSSALVGPRLRQRFKHCTVVYYNQGLMPRGAWSFGVLTQKQQEFTVVEDCGSKEEKIDSF